MMKPMQLVVDESVRSKCPMSGHGRVYRRVTEVEDVMIGWSRQLAVLPKPVEGIDSIRAFFSADISWHDMLELVAEG